MSDLNEVEEAVMRIGMDGGDISNTKALALLIGESEETTEDARRSLTEKGLLEFDFGDDDELRGRIHAALRQMDDKLDPATNPAAVVLLGLYVMGPSAPAKKLATVVGIDEAEAAVIKGRIAGGGIITPQGGFDVDWLPLDLDKATDDAAFWCDVNVAGGLFERVKNEKGEWSYKVNDKGIGYVKKMLSGESPA